MDREKINSLSEEPYPAPPHKDYHEDYFPKDE